MVFRKDGTYAVPYVRYLKQDNAFGTLKSGLSFARAASFLVIALNLSWRRCRDPEFLK
jgi:hypothetical protein